MKLVGIENENEYFSAGFFSGALEDELTDVVNRWGEAEKANNPIARLADSTVDNLAVIEKVWSMSDRVEAEELRRAVSHRLLTGLGYTYARAGLTTDLDGEPLAAGICRVADPDGKDLIWILEAPTPGADDLASDPLGVPFNSGQFTAEEQEYAELRLNIEEVIDQGVFNRKDGPRFVLILGLSQLVLAERRKWGSRSVLRFDLHEILSRGGRDTLSAMACLLAREALAPETGVPLADRLEEEAQRHANAVTASLKETVRDAIELLGQEVLNVTGGKYPPGMGKDKWIDGKELSLECLRYMYRLLFLFYAEANPKLGVLNLKDPIYATGYSLQALRELEGVRLRSTADRNGTYLWESLKATLGLLYSGTDRVIRLPSVKVSLLDPTSTPILARVNLRNEAVQKIIRLMSLKKTRGGTSRISYAQLGIGQLGAVYETLISFTGFVAKDDLIELRPQTGRGSTTSDDDQETADAEQEEDDVDDSPDEYEDDADTGTDPISRSDKIDLLAPSYFVPKSRASEFKPEEIVFDGPAPRLYCKGTFIYRLAGRDREKSASYYTPEPLARLLVKHALMERCKDLTADQILELKILEPAMGSAAFLVETTNQLADLYLERKQKETGQTIAQEDYFLERQKVRAFISDRNCFGVDLNPVAVELGAISLWLNSLHNSAFSPWFGDQLHAGNSLIGARRASYAPKLMTATKKADLWFNHKPQEIGWRGTLPEGHIWQFLLPAKDMAKFDTDKSITEFAGDAQDQIKTWRKGGFFDKLQPHEIKLMQKLSRVTSELFEIVATDLSKSRVQSNDAITLWPEVEMPGQTGADFHEKERRKAKLIGEDHASNTLPYKRLKTAMDAWCALWLWPLDKADLLPSRQEFLNGMAMILEGGFTADGSLAAPSIEEFADPNPDFFGTLEPDAPAKDLFQASKKQQENLFRETNVEALVEVWDWLGVAGKVAEDARFVHFDLIFADILKARGGFDIIVGNPPWARLGFNETEEIGDIDPGFVVRKLSAAETRLARAEALEQAKDRNSFLSAYASAKGAMAVTASDVMNPFAGAGRNNLYRCFIDLSFRQLAPKGFAAIIHQDGHLTDPKSGPFRRSWYERITKHFQFRNEMRSKNFSEVANNKYFSLNVYRGSAKEVNFLNFSNAFIANQVEESFFHDGVGPMPTDKNASGKWDTRGHRGRLVSLSSADIAAIHAVSEGKSGDPLESRFLQPYSASILKAFQAYASTSRLDQNVLEWQISGIWNEVNAQREQGVIKRQTAFPNKISETVLTGSMIHVANPLYKSPRRNCQSNKDYDVVDFNIVDNEYLPRTNFQVSTNRISYISLSPKCSWDSTKSHIDANRIGFRAMIDPKGERSLVPALLAPGIAHIHGVNSVAFRNTSDLLTAYPAWISILYDFLIKSASRQNLNDADIASLPWVVPSRTAMHRALRLACLTNAYASLWNEQADTLSPLAWHSNDLRLTLDGPAEGPATWDRTAALRNDFARRMALVEIDVLVAQALGLTLDQLIDIYRIYFPVLQQNEAGTWYDRNGRIAWTCSKGLPGIGYLEDGKSPSRKNWEKIIEDGRTHLECQAVVDFMPGGPQTITRIFEGPFDICDRVEDYKRAWAYFEAHKAAEDAA